MFKRIILVLFLYLYAFAYKYKLKTTESIRADFSYIKKKKSYKV